MTTEFRPEDYSPRQLVTSKELDRIACTLENELTSEEIGHHASCGARMINAILTPTLLCVQAVIVPEL